MYAEVLISYQSKALDKTFTYLVPADLQNKLKVGMKVKVPFANKKINGFVLKILDSYQNDYELKEIDSIENEEIVLNKELIDLGKYLKEKTLCSLMTAYEVMLPKGIKARSQKNDYSKTNKYLILNTSIDEINYYLTKTKSQYQKDILLDLLECEEIKKSNYNQSSINTLKEKQLIKEVSKKEYRINVDKTSDLIEEKCTTEQINAINNIAATFNSSKVNLLFGVTGSGKTRVYIELIKKVLKIGKTAIILVPEISLTAQTAQKFYDYFGTDVAIFHSALSDGEKYDEYLKIIRGEVHVVVGTRSAIFAPLNNLGIIVIDEEHSDTYKQDNNPRYSAKNIAFRRGIYHNCPVLLASATPSLESMARAQKGIFNLVNMPTRINKSYPEVVLVDMADEMKKRNTIFSSKLLDEIKISLDNNKQIIIFLNRRGFSTYINCVSCGFTYKCPHCDISLTYHKTSNNLRCHYCGYTVIKSDKCPVCHEKALTFLGLGTEKLEQVLKEKFVDASIVRMDADTTTKKGSHEKIISDFQNHKYDILLGTQMISKGLDFPNVTLVGVINADTSLNIPDYKAGENTFSLLNQVSGRAGRGEVPGKVIIQTFNTDNYALQMVKENNYLKYYNYEMNIRHTLAYPPYFYLASIKVISDDYEVASKESIKVRDYLNKNLKDEVVLGPTTAAMFKFGNKYRFQIIVKYKKEENILKILKELDEIYLTNSKCYLEIDLNPSKI